MGETTHSEEYDEAPQIPEEAGADSINNTRATLLDGER